MPAAGMPVRGRFRRRVAPGEHRSASIVEASTAPACALDPTGRVLAANQALEELLGAQRHGLVNRSMAALTYPTDAESARKALGAMFAEDVDRYQVDLRSVRLDNQQMLWGTWDLSLVRDTRGRPTVVVAIVRDRTDMVRSEQERRFFEFLLKIIGEAEDSAEMLAAAVQTICHFTRCAMGQVWMPLEGGLICTEAWYYNGYGFDQLRQASEMVRYEHGAGLPGLVWATGEPQQITDVRDPARFDRAAGARRAGVHEALGVPVIASGGLVAVLELFVTDDRAEEAGRLERIARVAGELGPLVERKRAEEALRESEERFRQVTAAAKDAIVSAGSDGLLKSWNTGAEAMFGWRAEEVIGQPISIIIPERFRAMHDAGFARVRDTGESKLAGQVVELEAIRKDGGEFPIELSIGVWESTEGMQFSGVIRDITERKRAEVVMRASEERFRGVTEAAQDAIVSADSDGLLRSWNRGAEQLFGWHADEVIGQPLTVIIPDRFKAMHEEGISRVRATGHSKLAGQVVELAAIRKDGSELPVELSIGMWQSSEGVQFSGVIRDITERKRAEEAITAANRELERSNAELETLVYSASHDLKSPMVSLLGYLEYLKLDYGEALGDEGGRYLDRLFDRALHMQRLITDLIDLSRVGRSGGAAADVDLGEVVRFVAEEIAAVAPAAAVKIGALPIVAGDPVTFRQLLTNLIENAVAHGGRSDPTIAVEAAPLPDGALELVVRDDGKGIPPEHRERVFGVFERLDGTSPGTGMGLAICRKIVELMDGTISAHGGEGGGTEIRVVLPASLVVQWPSAETAPSGRGALL
jgi:two-component system, LuxR family, sensor kinase FixL